MGNIAMLGAGLIGSFYTMTLHSLRSPDRVSIVYSRSAERGEKFRADFGVPKATTDASAGDDLVRPPVRFHDVFNC